MAPLCVFACTKDFVVLVHRVIVVITALAASACSSTSSTTPDLPANTRTSAYVNEAAAQIAYRPEARFDVPERLEEAVIRAAERRPIGDIPVRLAMTITRYEVVGTSARLFHGIFAGWNKLHVTVAVIDTRNGTVIGAYAVRHEESLTSDAAFGDQSRLLIDAAGELVVAALYRPGPPKLDLDGVPPP